MSSCPVCYWFAYIVTMAVADGTLAATRRFEGDWGEILDIVLASRSAPIAIWALWTSGQWRSKLLVVVLALGVWGSERPFLHWLNPDALVANEELLMAELATPIAAGLLAAIVGRLSGNLCKSEDAAGHVAARPQFMIRDLFIATTIVAVLTALLMALFASAGKTWLGGLVLLIMLWIATSAALLGVAIAWGMFSLARPALRGVVGAGSWLAVTAASYFVSSEGRPFDWAEVAMFASLHLGQAAIAAAALAPWWLQAFKLHRRPIAGAG